MAVEDEIRRWSSFAKALRREEREAFDAIMDACRSYASAASNATKPVLFEPMVMSILVSQQIRLEQLQKEVETLKAKQGCISEQR
jgi:hypothetical protein